MRLGGIPLALELAAARVGVLGVEQILARLDGSFRLLIGGSRVMPTRHQTLRAALDWSDNLLSEPERVVFERLAVFAGEFQLRAAEAICIDAEVPPDAVLDVLSGLVNKSLVASESDEHEAWYHLLEPVRQYAMGHLRERGDFAKISARHTSFYLEFAERTPTESRGPNQESWLATLEREQGNLRAALERGIGLADANATLRLAGGLVPFWEAHGHLNEDLSWL